MSTMIQDRNAEYVANWPINAAHALHCGVGHVTKAITEITGTYVDEDAALRGMLQDGVAAMTATQAQQVARRVTAALDALAADARTHCHTCGLPLGRDGRCAECI